jgi:AcrR family transcriptional regulator
VSTAPPVESDKPTGPRSRKGVETRTRLVQAAKAVFEEHGFLDARISDIAEQAGLSHGSFYHYFESKDEAFLEVVEAQEGRLSSNSAIDSRLLDPSSGATIRERLQESIGAYLADYRDEARLMGVIEQVSRYHDQVRLARFARLRTYTRRTEDSIRRLQAEGLADQRLDPTIAAPALIALVTRFVEMWLVQHLIECDLDDAVEQLTTLCMNTLRLEDSPGSLDGRPQITR